ncbi:MAG: glycosyltransferase [Myxococcales bacterium]|nr:glycosyltransferase [Myxococcales bacterium]
MSAERILVVSTSFPRVAGDPAGHFVATEAAALVRAGHCVTVIAPGEDRVIEGVPVVGLPDGGAFGWPGALARLRERPTRAMGALAFTHWARRALREHAHDRLIAHWLLPGAWPIASASSAPLEVVAHGSDVRVLARLPRRLRQRIVAELRERGARIRCVSQQLAGELAALDPRIAERVTVEPAPLDTDGAPSRAEARALLGVAEDERLLVIAGRLVREKRLDVALAAAELIPEARVVVLGDGPEHSRLRELSPSARFLGLLPRDRALAWIAAADLVLSASRTEGAPTVLREARALGVPIVSAVAGDLARWAEQDRDVWTVT